MLFRSLKSTAESLRHRADLGGVRLDIGDEDELRDDVAQMRAALEDLLARMSLMADELPELRSVEVYPVVVAEHGAAVLGARVQVAGAQRADALRRALPG